MYKKKKKSCKLSVVALFLVCCLAVSSIFAYFTDTDSATNVFTVGNVKVTLEEPSWVPPENILPGQVIAKDPQINNSGFNDEFVFMEVRVPYAIVEGEVFARKTVEDRVVIDYGLPVDISVLNNDIFEEDYAAGVELFSYEINDGWVEIGEPVRDVKDKIVSHVYAYSKDNVMSTLSPGQTTIPLFNSVTFVDAIQGLGLEKSMRHVIVNAYGIQTNNLFGSGANGVTDPEFVWTIFENQRLTDRSFVEEIIPTGEYKIVGVGPATNPENRGNMLADGFGDTYNTEFGVAKVNGHKVRYTLNTSNGMQMNKAEMFSYAVEYTDNGEVSYYYGSVTVIPAANMYFEDLFLSFEDSIASDKTDDVATYGEWVQVGSPMDKTQQEDRPGVDVEDILGDVDSDNVYGYDPAYSDCTTYSLGSAYKVTVDSKTGNANTAPSALFTFTGTGFDVVSLTDKLSGALWVQVLKPDGTRVQSIIVNNYYGMIYNSETGDWEIAEEDVNNALYQVPVIKVTGLEYGTYNVVVKAAYLGSMDAERVGYYNVWLDAIRIYNSAKNDDTSNDAYEEDSENNATLTTVKKLIISPEGLKDGETGFANGFVFVEGKDSDVSMKDYENAGPNNETYLKDGNGVAFRLRSYSEEAPQISLQVGSKLVAGNSAILYSNGRPVTFVTTATNMFYKLNNLVWTKSAEGYWESNPIMFSCTADDAGVILSITDLKVTGKDATSIAQIPADGSVSSDTLYAVIDQEVIDFLRQGMGLE